MTIINRILEWKSDRTTFEADLRHFDMIIKGMGLVNGKGSDVVGSDVKQSEGEEELCKEDAIQVQVIGGQVQLLECGSA